MIWMPACQIGSERHRWRGIQPEPETHHPKELAPKKPANSQPQTYWPSRDLSLDPIHRQSRLDFRLAEIRGLRGLEPNRQHHLKHTAAP